MSATKCARIRREPSNPGDKGIITNKAEGVQK